MGLPEVAGDHQPFPSCLNQLFSGTGENARIKDVWRSAIGKDAGSGSKPAILSLATHWKFNLRCFNKIHMPSSTCRNSDLSGMREVQP